MAVDIVVRIEGDDKALKAINQLDSAEKKRKKNFEALNREAQNSSASYTNAVRTSSNETNKLASVAKKAGGIIAAAFAVQQLVSFGKEILDVTKKFEGYSNAIKFASGSAEEGEKNLAFLRKTVDKLGLDLESSIKGFQTLQSSAKAAGVSTDETREVFESVSTAVSAMNLSAEDSEGVFLALGQILSKGTVQAEELRGQIGERLPGAFNIAAKSMGVTTQELNKLLEQGKVVSTDFLPKFAKQLREDFGGALDKSTNSLQANTNRLKNSFTELQLAIGDRFSSAVSAASLGLNRFVKSATDYLKVPVSAKLTEEKNTLNALFGAIQNTNKGSEERRILIGRINAIAPELIKNVNLETASNKLLQTTLISVNKEYDKKIFLQATEEKQVEFAKKRADIFLKQADLLQAIEERTVRIQKLEKGGNASSLANARIQQRFNQDELNFNKIKLKNLLKQETEFLEKVRSAKKIAGIKDEEVEPVKDVAKSPIGVDLKKIEEIQREAIEQQIALLTASANLRKEQLNAQNIGYQEARDLVNQIFVIESQIARIKANQEGTQASFINLQTEELRLARERIKALNEIGNVEKIKTQQIQQDKLESVKKFIDKSLNQELNAAAKRREAERKDADLSVSIQEEKWAKIGNIAEIGGQFLGQISSGLFEADAQKRQNELTAIDQQEQYKLGLVGDNAQAQSFIQEEADKKRKVLQEKQAKADKQKALFDVLIQTAVNVVKALGTPPVPNFGAAAIAGGAGIIQGAAIAAVPLPKFKKGTESLQRGNNPRGVDTIPILANEGERIVPTHINKLLGKLSNEDLPVMLGLAKGVMKTNNNGLSTDSIRKAFSEALRERPLTVTNFDKDGVSSWVVAENSKTKILNNDNSF